MDLQKELDKIKLDYLDDDRFVKENSITVYYAFQEYKELDDALKKAYLDEESRLENIKIMVENLPFILKYTTDKSEWLSYRELYFVDGVIEKFIDALKYFPFALDKTRLYSKINKYINNKDSLNKDFFKALFFDNTNSYGFIELFNELDEKTKTVFLEAMLESRVSVSFKGYNINGLSYSYMLDNLESFLDLSNDFFTFNVIFKNNKDALSRIDNFYSDRFDLIGKAILNEGSLRTYNDDIKELFLMIIDDIYHNRNAKASEIYWLPFGAFCDVLVISDKVIKFGLERDTDTFPNNPYIVKPLLRRSFNIGGQDIFIEVTEVADTTEEFTPEDCYIVYKRLRSLGIVAADIHDQNIGRLKKDNIIHWNGCLCPSDDNLMLEKYIGDEELKAGDLVLIDGDSLYKVGDGMPSPFNYPNYIQFEDRYQKELSLR